MSVRSIGFAEGEARLDWLTLTDALAAGHRLPKAEIADTFLRRGGDTLLSRAAWIDGMGIAVKSATVFPGNAARGLSTIGGAASLFSDETGALDAMIDFHLVTKWKTVGDSLLAARRLARPESARILLIGAGNVARSLREAYPTVFPEARFTVWNRTRAAAERFAADDPMVDVADDLEAAVGASDIIAAATMTTEPILCGAWLRPGQHVDLIGAYRPDMREADDTALQRARVFVDSYETTLGHIGELKIPLAAGVITADDVIADYYDLDAFTRSPEDITLFKNGGGAHLDLMTCRYILDACSA